MAASDFVLPPGIACRTKQIALYALDGQVLGREKSLARDVGDTASSHDNDMYYINYANKKNYLFFLSVI